MFTEFKESGIEVLFGLWFAKTDFLDLKNSIMKDITARFAAEGIWFASPNRRGQDCRGLYLLMICSRRGPTEIHLMGVRILLLDEQDVVARLRQAGPRRSGRSRCPSSTPAAPRRRAPPRPGGARRGTGLVVSPPIE